MLSFKWNFFVLFPFIAATAATIIKSYVSSSVKREGGERKWQGKFPLSGKNPLTVVVEWAAGSYITRLQVRWSSTILGAHIGRRWPLSLSKRKISRTFVLLLEFPFLKNSSAGRNVYGRELREGNHDDHLTPGRLFGGFTA